MSKRIPKEEFFIDEQFDYITIDLFNKYHSEEDRVNFCKWLSNQTCSLVGNVVAIYSWDYERWLRQGKKNEQGSDWD